MADPIVTVFGGRGFLGRRVVRRLLAQGLPVRIASRHPEPDRTSASVAAPSSMAVDIGDEDAVAAAVTAAYGVVNSVSLYRERGSQSFHAVHVEAAERVARQAQRAGVERLIHVSGIGADATSRSLYVRKRGEGELAVQRAFRDAIIVRPAVMFGPDDTFLNTLVRLLKRLPVFPMFGRGLTRLQPVHVEDVAEAIVRVLEPTAIKPATYELGGPCVYSFKELLAQVAERLGKQPLLLSVPFPVWHALARITEVLPQPPLSRNQVELMELDTVVSAGMSGFPALGITPQAIDRTLKQLLRG